MCDFEPLCDFDHFSREKKRYNQEKLKNFLIFLKIF